MTATNAVKIKFHLASGVVVSTFSETTDSEVTADDVAEELHEALKKLSRPGWMLIENVVFHTQALQAIEVI